MQGVSMTCDGCGRRIEDLDNPIVVYVVAGIAPLHPLAAGVERTPLHNFDMPQELRDLFDNGSYQHEARAELCARCFGTTFKSKSVGPEADKNEVKLRGAQLVKELNRPTKATPGRIPLPAALHTMSNEELQGRFESLRLRTASPEMIAAAAKKKSSRAVAPKAETKKE